MLVYSVHTTYTVLSVHTRRGIPPQFRFLHIFNVVGVLESFSSSAERVVKDRGTYAVQTVKPCETKYLLYCDLTY